MSSAENNHQFTRDGPSPYGKKLTAVSNSVPKCRLQTSVDMDGPLQNHAS